MKNYELYIDDDLEGYFSSKTEIAKYLDISLSAVRFIFNDEYHLTKKEYKKYFIIDSSVESDDKVFDGHSNIINIDEQYLEFLTRKV